MLRLTLADSVVAAGSGGLELRASVDGSRLVPPGEGLHLILDARNTGPESITLSQLFLRGSLESVDVLDTATFNQAVLAPGQRLTRELRSSVTDSASTGAYVVAAGAELADGSAISSLVSFDRIEPYALKFDVDSNPIGSFVQPTVQKNNTKGWLRVAAATVTSRVHNKVTATVDLKLPQGWALDGGELTRTLTLRYAGDIQGQYFRIVIPAGTPSGVYPIGATLDVAGRAYSASGTITVQ
jgi:hypothetical protein